MYSKKRHLAYQQIPPKTPIFGTLLSPVSNERHRIVNGLTKKLEGHYGPETESIYYQCRSKPKCSATFEYIQKNVPNQN